MKQKVEAFQREILTVCIKHRATLVACSCCSAIHGAVDGESYKDFFIGKDDLREKGVIVVKES